MGSTLDLDIKKLKLIIFLWWAGPFKQKPYLKRYISHYILYRQAIRQGNFRRKNFLQCFPGNSRRANYQ